MAEQQPKIGEGAGPRTLAKAVPPRERSAADRVRAAEFATAMRGYDRDAVDAFVAQAADLIDMLESRQARETVVQRALDEVGEETSAILKQAHESADDITARSRSQAEDRVEVARQEAASILRDARQQAAELKREIAHLGEERAQLIDELRRFGMETLAVADAAAERLDPSTQDEVVEAPVEEPVEAAVDGVVEAPVEEAPVEGVVEAPAEEAAVEEPPDPPYDRVHDLDPAEEWPEGQSGQSSQSTHELSIPAPEPREDEPPSRDG